MSSVADSAPAGLDRAAMTKALSNCLQMASFYGKVADTKVLTFGAVSLQNAMPDFSRSQRLSFVWNSALGAPTLRQHQNTKAAFTTLMKVPNSKFCSAPVRRSSCDSVWLHKTPAGDWRCGESLGAGKTLLTSSTTGGLEPPTGRLVRRQRCTAR